MLSSVHDINRSPSFEATHTFVTSTDLFSVQTSHLQLLSSLQVSYSTFMHGLKEENIQVNRKVLSELAMQEPYSFKSLVDQVKFMRGSSP